MGYTTETISDIHYNNITLVQAFQGQTFFDPGFYSFTVYDVEMKPKKVANEDTYTEQTLQAVLTNKLGNLYEKTNPHDLQYLVKVEQDREFLKDYDGLERCDHLSGCGQLVWGTTADEKKALEDFYIST